jgi:RNA polymerase sigma-70 factor (ECF subfamily)
LDYLKKRRHISLDDTPELLSNSPSPQEQAVKNENAKELHIAVRKLPVKYQTVISLYYWQDQKYEDIAEILNIPIGTVRTWLKRAKTQLKEELNG